MAKEASIKLNETVKHARDQEQTKAKEILDRHKEDFTNQISQLQRLLADKDLELEALKEQIVDKERVITDRDQTLASRESLIAELNTEIARLNSIIEQNGMQAGDLSN